MTRNIIFLTIAAAIISLTGCKKVEDVNNNDMLMTTTGNNGGGASGCPYRTFATFDLFSAEVDKTTGFSYDELVAYEQSIKFDSYGKLADQAMMEVLKKVDVYMAMEDTIAAHGKALQELQLNTAFLQLVTEEDGEQSCETKYYRSTYRYVMNTDRVLKVDTLFYKVFEGGHASCGTSHYNALLNMSEAQFSLLGENDPIFNVFKYDDDDGAKGNYGKSVTRTTTSGKNRVHVNLKYLEFGPRVVFLNTVGLDGEFWVKTWSQHKTLGIWWNVQHTYTNDISAKLFINGSLRTGTDKGSNGGFKREKRLLSLREVFPNNPDPIYIHSCSGYGKIPGITCYMNLN